MNIFLTRKYHEEYTFDFRQYNIFEFSYGGSSIVNYLNFFYDNLKLPNDRYKAVFSKNNIQNKKIVATSAGAIFVGLTLLNIVSDFRLNGIILDVIKYASENLPSKNFLYYLSLATAQKEFLSKLIEVLPLEYSTMTIADVVEKLDMKFDPGIVCYKFPNSVRFCDRKTSIVDAIQQSSDILGGRDGGFSQLFNSSLTIFDDQSKALVFSVTKYYKPMTPNYDLVYLS